MTSDTKKYYTRRLSPLMMVELNSGEVFEMAMYKNSDILMDLV